MRLMIIEPWGERLGGAENMLWSFLRHIDPLRIEPLIVFLQQGPFEREVAGLGIRTLVIPAGRLRDLRAFARVVGSLAAALRRERPDLLLNWMAKTQVYGSLAALLSGMADRVVWWQHEVPHGHWLDRLATLLPTRAVGCSSRASAQAQLRLWPARQTFVVHPGIDDPSRLDVPDRASRRRDLGIPRERTVIGIVGRLQASKGQARLLRVLARLRQADRDVHGFVVGGDAFRLSPSYERFLHDLVVELDLGGAVTFTGQVPDASPYIEAMDILVNASDAEPFGIVLLEAMARGVPVVAFDSAGPAEIVETERSGLLVRARDDAALADALDLLIGDPDLRQNLAAAGRRRVQSCFGATRMTQELQGQLANFARANPARRVARVG